MFKKILINTSALMASLALADNSCATSPKNNGDSKIIAVINKEMCSKNCPCPSEAEKFYLDMHEKNLNEYERTFYNDFSGFTEMRFLEHGRTFNTF